MQKTRIIRLSGISVTWQLTTFFYCPPPPWIIGWSTPSWISHRLSVTSVSLVLYLYVWPVDSFVLPRLLWAPDIPIHAFIQHLWYLEDLSESRLLWNENRALRLQPFPKPTVKPSSSVCLLPPGMMFLSAQACGLEAWESSSRLHLPVPPTVPVSPASTPLNFT